jgi:hypothetical protein
MNAEIDARIFLAVHNFMAKSYDFPESEYTMSIIFPIMQKVDPNILRKDAHRIMDLAVSKGLAKKSKLSGYRSTSKTVYESVGSPDPWVNWKEAPAKQMEATAEPASPEKQ